MALQTIERLFEHARRQPDATALREVDAAGQLGRSLTYGQLGAAVVSLAASLRRQAEPGDVVLVCYPNQLEYAVAFYATLTAGLTLFPVHPQLAERETVYAAERARVSVVVASSQAEPLFTARGASESIKFLSLDGFGTAPSSERPPTLPDLDWSDSARLLLQSSGTTGQPKIVQRSGPSLDAVARNVMQGARLQANDRVLGLVPACHSYGVENVMLGPMLAGCCVHLCRKLDAPLLVTEIERGGITVIPGAPSIFEMLSLVDAPRDAMRSVRCVYSAGAILPAAVFDTFERRFGVRIGQLYGMTEIGSVTFNDPYAEGHDPASVGAGLDGVRIRIVDRENGRIDRPLEPGEEGEVAVSAPSMLTGYLDESGRCMSPDAVRDGFFMTGDLGRIDQRGHLTITGRLKLIIDVGGLKVNLLEVEQVLRQHESVEDCVVVAVPVSETVSRLKAYVCPVPSIREADGSLPSEALRSYMRARLAAHKVPRVFERRVSFPRSPTGKILRHLL